MDYHVHLGKKTVPDTSVCGSIENFWWRRFVVSSMLTPCEQSAYYRNMLVLNQSCRNYSHKNPKNPYIFIVGMILWEVF